MPNTKLKIDGAVTLSFYRAAEFGGKEHIDYVFPLFPRKGLNDLFPSIKGKAEHYCAFALPEHGSITFRCNLIDSLKEHHMANYKEFVAMLDKDALRVKAYYPILHTLKSFGSDFAFKDTDLATCNKVKKVFDSFLFMSERINQWSKNGAQRVQENVQQEDKIDASMFRKEISCLRIEVSFMLNVPDEKLDNKVIMAWMKSLLGKDLNVVFGHGGKENILTRSVDFISVNDWLQRVRKVREMLTTRATGKGGINFMMRPGSPLITSRGKQQAECLQSLLGYCCRKTNSAVRSRLWGVVWNANAEQEYPGMWRRFFFLLNNTFLFIYFCRDCKLLGTRVGLE